MRHTARSYLVEVVVPAYAAFVEQYATRELGLQRDTAAAASLAETLLHLPDHVYRDASTKVDQEFSNIRQYRESFWPQSFAYELICDFANAWKHRHITRTGRKIDGLEDVMETLAAVAYQDEEGTYGCTQKLLIVKATDNHQHDLTALLDQALDLWMKELTCRGVVTRAPALPSLPPLAYSREQAAQLPKMRIVGQAGEYLEVHQKLLVCDPNSCTLRSPTSNEKVQLTYEVEFDVARSPFDPPTKR